MGETPRCGSTKELTAAHGKRSIFPARVICTNHVRILVDKNTSALASLLFWEKRLRGKQIKALLIEQKNAFLYHILYQVREGALKIWKRLWKQFI